MWFSGRKQPRLISWPRWPWRDVSTKVFRWDTHQLSGHCACMCVCDRHPSSLAVQFITHLVARHSVWTEALVTLCMHIHTRGIFFGFWFLSNGLRISIELVCQTCSNVLIYVWVQWCNTCCDFYLPISQHCVKYFL